jgi:hypothetical protein
MSGGRSFLSYDQSRGREMEGQITKLHCIHRGLALDPDPGPNNVPSVTSRPFQDYEFSIRVISLSKSSSHSS